MEGVIILAKLILKKWDEGDITGRCETELWNYQTHHITEKDVKRELVSKLRKDGQHEIARQIENNSIPIEFYREPKIGSEEATWIKIDRMAFDEIGRK